jgi:hypothetical protein
VKINVNTEKKEIDIDLNNDSRILKETNTNTITHRKNRKRASSKKKNNTNTNDKNLIQSENMSRRNRTDSISSTSSIQPMTENNIPDYSNTVYFKIEKVIDDSRLEKNTINIYSNHSNNCTDIQNTNDSNSLLKCFSNENQNLQNDENFSSSNISNENREVINAQTKEQILKNCLLNTEKKLIEGTFLTSANVHPVILLLEKFYLQQIQSSETELRLDSNIIKF